MADTLVRTGKLVTVFGGGGFVGRSVVKALAAHGWRVRVASRRPSLSFALQPSGLVGQIAAVQANLRYPDSVVRAVRDADAVVNLVGLLAERGPQTFEAIHAKGVQTVAEAAKAGCITRFVQMSAIGADPTSSAIYARTKAKGESTVLRIIPEAIIVRPSVVFGPEDKFFNRFAAMARLMPALPLIGDGTGLLQPVFVGDVAEAIARAIDGHAKPGTIYELGGPDAHAFKEILAFILKTTGRHRPLVPLPFPAAELMGRVTEVVKTATFGLLPEILDMTRDQVELLKSDNVVSAAAKAEGRTLEGLGIMPESYQSFVPTYLYRFRKTGQYASNQSV
jgi:NADH dehydrogenase